MTRRVRLALAFIVGALLGFAVGRPVLESVNAARSAEPGADRGGASERARDRRSERGGLPRGRGSFSREDLTGLVVRQEPGVAARWPGALDLLVRRLQVTLTTAGPGSIASCLAKPDEVPPVLRLRVSLDSDASLLRASAPRVVDPDVSGAERACIEALVPSAQVEAGELGGALPQLEVDVIVPLLVAPQPVLDALVDAGASSEDAQPE